MRTVHLRAGLTALSFGAALFFSAAPAQTVVTTAPPDPLVTSLRDQVNDLETQVRNLTGENERLNYELRQARDENTRLKRTIDDMNSQGAALGAAAPAAPPAPPPSTASAAGVLGELPASALATAPAAPAAPAQDAASAFDAAYDFIRRSDFGGAESAFRSFLTAYPRDAKAPDARFYLGQTLLQRGAASDAAEQFLAIVQNSPRASRAPEAMVRLGVALNRMGEKDQACATLKALPTQYPSAAAGVKASATAQIRAIGC